MFRRLRYGIKKIFGAVNQQNSMMGVQCIAPEKCSFRFTTACDDCKNNIGIYKDKVFYEPK